MWRCIHITQNCIVRHTSQRPIYERGMEKGEGEVEKWKWGKWEEVERASKASCHSLICLNTAYASTAIQNEGLENRFVKGLFLVWTIFSSNPCWETSNNVRMCLMEPVHTSVSLSDRSNGSTNTPEIAPGQHYQGFEFFPLFGVS